MEHGNEWNDDLGARERRERPCGDSAALPQRIGLRPTPPRAYGSIRRHSKTNLQRLRFIKRAPQLGFSLEKVAQLLASGANRRRAATRDMAARKACNDRLQDR